MHPEIFLLFIIINEFTVCSLDIHFLTSSISWILVEKLLELRIWFAMTSNFIDTISRGCSYCGKLRTSSQSILLIESCLLFFFWMYEISSFADPSAFALSLCLLMYCVSSMHIDRVIVYCACLTSPLCYLAEFFFFAPWIDWRCVGSNKQTVSESQNLISSLSGLILDMCFLMSCWIILYLFQRSWIKTFIHGRIWSSRKKKGEENWQHGIFTNEMQ